MDRPCSVLRDIPSGQDIERKEKAGRTEERSCFPPWMLSTLWDPLFLCRTVEENRFAPTIVRYARFSCTAGRICPAAKTSQMTSLVVTAPKMPPSVVIVSMAA